MPRSCRVTLIPRQLSAFRERLLKIDTELTPLTDRFTRTLGDATRKTKFILLLVNLAAAGMLIPIGIWLSQRMLRHSEERRASAQAQRGALQSRGDAAAMTVCGTGTSTPTRSTTRRASSNCSGYAERRDGKHRCGRDRAAASGGHRRHRTAALEAHLQRAVPFDVEMRLLTQAGRVSLVPLRAASRCAMRTDQPVRMAGALTDITDRSSPRPSCSPRRSARR